MKCGMAEIVFTQQQTGASDVSYVRCSFYQNDKAREETRKAGEPVLGECDM